MKIYIFHRVTPGLTPLFYAYTNDGEIASEFRVKREHMSCRMLDIGKKEYTRFRDKHIHQEIMWYTFQSLEDGRYVNVTTVATEKEIMEIEIYGEEMIRREFNRFKVPSSLFKDKYRNAIEELTSTELGMYLFFGKGYDIGMEGLECPFIITDKYKLFKFLYERRPL